jgi:hypothetical protein
MIERRIADLERLKAKQSIPMPIYHSEDGIYTGFYQMANGEDGFHKDLKGTPVMKDESLDEWIRSLSMEQLSALCNVKSISDSKFKYNYHQRVLYTH